MSRKDKLDKLKREVLESLKNKDIYYINGVYVVKER